MKKSFIAVIAVFAVIIIFGLLTPLFTDVGDYRFKDGWTVTITNEVFSQKDFDGYIESVEAHMAQQGIAYQTKQLITNEFEENTAVLYDFYALKEEQKTSLTAFLATQNYISYNVSDIKGDNHIRAVIFAAIGAGVVLVLQFLYYLFAHKKFMGVAFGLSATASSLLALLITVAFSLIIALIGVKFTPQTPSAVLLVLLVSVFVNAVMFEKVKYNADTLKKSFDEAKELALAQNKKFLAVFFAPLMIAALVLAAIFMGSLLSFGLTLLWGLACLYVQAIYLTLQLWKDKNTR